MNMIYRYLFSLALVCAAPPPAKAGTDGACGFQTAQKLMSEAYAGFRGGAFYLHTGNAGVALLELDGAVTAWKALIKRCGTAPPDPYRADAAWGDTLTKIGVRFEKALALAEADDPETAGKALAPVRRLLSDLRRRNSVVVYSDHVDRANAALEELYHFRHHPPDFTDEKALNELRRRTAVTTYLWRKVRDEAPPAVRDDPEFKRLMDTSLYSLGRIWVAISEKNERNLINILRELRSSDRILLFRFG